MSAAKKESLQISKNYAVSSCVEYVLLEQANLYKEYQEIFASPQT